MSELKISLRKLEKEYPNKVKETITKEIIKTTVEISKTETTTHTIKESSKPKVGPMKVQQIRQTYGKIFPRKKKQKKTINT